MLSKQEMATLRVQLWMVGGMLLIGAALAAALATQRDRFESYIRETFAEEFPRELDQLAARMTRGEIPRTDYMDLTPVQRDRFYDWWMTDSDRPASDALPRVLFRLEPARFVDRAKRTQLVGSLAQRRRGARFLREADHPEAEKLLEWARRRAGRRGEKLEETGRNPATSSLPRHDPWRIMHATITPGFISRGH